MVDQIFRFLNSIRFEQIVNDDNNNTIYWVYNYLLLAKHFFLKFDGMKMLAP